MPPSNITVLGGGITGLSAAFHLSRKFPSSRISLLEKSNRVGGWIQSKKVEFDIPGGDIGKLVLELGPRTLRPQSRALLEMINLLDLVPQVIGVSNSSAAARNRFLYLSDNQKSGLTPIPRSALGQLTSRLSLIAIPSAVFEIFRPENRPKSAEEDESFDSFMSRRFGAEFARVFGSALMHGIYAADSRVLSTRTTMPYIWEAEKRGNGSVVKGVFRSRAGERANTVTRMYETGGLEKILADAAVYSFENGLETLTNALKNNLEATPNVELCTSTEVNDIQPLDGSFRISTSTGPLLTPYLVSTIPLPSLDACLSTAKLPHLKANSFSSVTVATFVFAAPPIQIHPEGFGYLIPRPKEGYENSTNPEGILGVVFDSCSLEAQDWPRGRLTKMTVMLGGPYTPVLPDFEDKAAIRGILFDTIQRQLGRRLPEPIHVEITRRHRCIPTPSPGHWRRMSELRGALEESPWDGKVEVIGAEVGGVSVGDCVEQGRNAGNSWES